MQITITEIRRIPFFTALEDDELQHIAAMSLVRQYERGDIILLEGEKGEGLYYVQAGLVKVFKTSREGKEQILHLISSGYTFNDVAALDGGPSPASAGALEASCVYLLRRTELQALLQTRPPVADAVIKTLTSRLRQMASLTEDLSLRDSLARVAKLLLARHDVVVTGPIAHRLTQQEIAALTGTAREVVGRALKRLEVAGAIEVRQGRVTVLDRERLALVVHGVPET